MDRLGTDSESWSVWMLSVLFYGHKKCHHKMDQNAVFRFKMCLNSISEFFTWEILLVVLIGAGTLNNDTINIEKKRELKLNSFMAIYG